MNRAVIPAQRDARHRRGNPVGGFAVGRPAVPRRPVRGFTLVELLITVAAVAVLATIAYPTYVGYTVRANRAAAQSFLIDLARREQLYLLDARGYADSLAKLGAAPVPPEIASYYLVADPIADNTAAPPTFTVSATARAGTVQANDGDLGINSVGVRSGHW